MLLPTASITSTDSVFTSSHGRASRRTAVNAPTGQRSMMLADSSDAIAFRDVSRLPCSRRGPLRPGTRRPQPRSRTGCSAQWMQRVCVRLDQWAEVLVLHRALVLFEARAVEAVSHRLVPRSHCRLIADRAVERMVDQQEFHQISVARLAHGRGVSLNHHMPSPTGIAQEAMEACRAPISTRR